MICWKFTGEIRAVLASVLATSALACGPSRRPAEPMSTYVAPPSDANASAPIEAVETHEKRVAPSSSRVKLAKSDARPSPNAPRAVRHRSLVLTEIQGLESLLQVTKTNDPSIALLARRLAEDYAELEKGALAEGATSIEANARDRAIHYYLQVLDARNAATHSDEVSFFLAREYEQGGDFARARRCYLDVVLAPNSRYAPHAMIAFGDVFFDEATSDDSKWKLAEEAYLKVLDYGALQNRVYGYALYKLGWTLEHEGDREKALRFFHQAIEFANANALDAELARIGHLARADLAALVGESNVALSPNDPDVSAW